MTGQGRRLRGNTFHHIPVTAHDIGVMVDDLAVGFVVHGGQMPFGHGHAHGVCKALTQRAGGGFHPWGVAELGMSWCFAAMLAKVLEVVQGKVITGEMQHAVYQHGCMSAGEHKTIAVEPVWIFRVVPHGTHPQHISGRGQAHGCPRMP